MKRRMRVITLTVILALVLSTAGAFACTGMYVGKDVSAEGTTVIAAFPDFDVSTVRWCRTQPARILIIQMADIIHKTGFSSFFDGIDGIPDPVP